MLVTAGLAGARDHALISLLALNGLRVTEAIGADIERLGLERGHRTLVVLRKGGKTVTIPLAPRTARAVDFVVGERSDGPIFIGRARHLHRVHLHRWRVPITHNTFAPRSTERARSGQSALVPDDQLDRVSRLCVIADEMHTSGLSIAQLFKNAAPDLNDAARTQALIHDYIVARPELVQRWQQYSWDIRSTPNHYMEGVEVGFYDAGHHDVVHHRDIQSACADFITRTAAWIIERRRLGEAAQ
jgi:hypothetical protein